MFARPGLLESRIGVSSNILEWQSCNLACTRTVVLGAGWVLFGLRDRALGGVGNIRGVGTFSKGTTRSETGYLFLNKEGWPVAEELI